MVSGFTRRDGSRHGGMKGCRYGGRYGGMGGDTVEAMSQSIRAQVENQAKPDSREDILRTWIEQNRRTSVRKIERDCNVAMESFL